VQIRFERLVTFVNSRTRPSRKKFPNHSTVGSRAVILSKPSFSQTLRQTTLDFRILGVLAAITIPVGISAQLSWIEFRCIGEPFIGSLKAACKDNHWRMILGGPLAYAIAFMTLVWMKDQPTLIQPGQQLLPYLLLLPICTLPFVHAEQTHDLIIRCTSLMFAMGFFFAARQKISYIISSAFKTPSFSARIACQKECATLFLSGELLHQEKNWIQESTLRVLNSIDTPPNNIEIDVKDLVNYGVDFIFIFVHIISFAKHQNANVTFTGQQKKTNQIRRDLRQTLTERIY